MKAYKGFDADWTCRGYQFAVGETYRHDRPAILCNAGFHACEYPLDVLAYYPPTGPIAEVELADVSAETSNNSKRAGATITIKAALTIAGLVSAAIEYTTARCAPAKAKHATGDSSAASAMGDSSAASATGDSSAASATGYRSAASATGDRSAASATGNRSAASATGDSSAASATGNSSAASATGYSSAASATGNSSAASATGDSSAASATGYSSAASATGYSSAASATGYRSAASATGDRSAASATGEQSVAAAFGYAGTAQADDTGAIVVAWWDDTAQRKRLTVGYVGEGGIEANVAYRCDDAGNLVRA